MVKCWPSKGIIPLPFLHPIRLTLLTSKGYLVTRCIGFNRKLLRGSPPVLGSVEHFCSNSLNLGSLDFCCKRRQALSWQPHQRIWGVRLGICRASTSPMPLTTSPEVRSRTRKEERRSLEHWINSSQFTITYRGITRYIIHAYAPSLFLETNVAGSTQSTYHTYQVTEYTNGRC